MSDGHPSLAHHRRLREVFDEAILLDAAGREVFLHRACAGDTALLEHARRLLHIHDKGLSFLEHPLDPAQLLDAEVPFSGNERFTDVRRIGSGGMGVVYEARDMLRDELVALKTLRRTGAADLYRLKREFRSLAGATHANLACLYELFVDDQHAFFTMELVRGETFVDHARLTMGPHGDARARAALVQLLEAVRTLHGHGILHRDIKPSNVLVTPAGRLVVLDFGLAAERRLESESGSIVAGGTPAYMAPEETQGAAPSEAGDWYSVGVTLYEALTGRLPFEGDISELLLRKTTTDPLPPSALVRTVARDLNDLCMGLLCRDPRQRLSGTAALRLLAGDDAPGAVIATPAAAFVGRQAELARLNHAWAAVEAGGAAIVAVHGVSGIGKSALVRRFLGEPRRALVLAGRCHDNESVPHKALDGVVDSLSRHLVTLSDQRLDELLPPDLWALARMFPVLRQLPAVSRPSARRQPESLDLPRVRRLAVAALRSLLSRLAAVQPLLVWIDDLQWADADSAALLDELLTPASPRGMLTLLCFRAEEVPVKPFLQAWLAGSGPERFTVPVEPLRDAEAHAVLTGLLSGETRLSGDDTQRLTREASGSPFVLEQLAFYASAAAETGHAATVSSVFEWRFSALPQNARVFLDVLAVCSRPMHTDVVCDAAGVKERQSLVASLRGGHFIRSSGSSTHVEAYHDRIREALRARLDTAQAREIHRRLAAALVAREYDDPEALFEHYRGAGASSDASIQAGRAAEKAGSALAFDRAAAFYGEALAHGPSSPAADVWKEGLATALANAGRPAEAGEAFLRAAATAERARAMELERRAAEQFLTGGHIDRGLALLRRGLQHVGLRFPGSPRASLRWLVWRRAKQWWRGLDFVERPAGQIEVATLERLDACWAAATRLALVDVVGASNFVAWHLQMALDAGEPARIVRGAALEASARTADWIYRSSAGPLVGLAARLADSVGTPQARGMTLLAEAISGTATGQWRRALELGERALVILRDECVGATWEVNIAQNMVIWGLMYMGDVGEVSRRVPALLTEGRSRGNLYLATELCTRSNYVWLAADDPDEGLRESEAAIERWSHEGFHRQHFSAMLARVQTALYRGDGPAAWALFEKDAARLQASMLLRVQALRIEAWYLRGRCALAVASARTPTRRWLSVARSCARRIRHERMPWSAPIGLLLEAGAHSLEGRREKACAALAAAVDQFDRAEMKLYAAVSRVRLGELLAGAEGEALRRQADAWMVAQPIRNPAAFTRMFAPGFDAGMAGRPLL